MPEVVREDDGATRRYVVRDPAGEAELSARVLSPSRVAADHTFVPAALRGRGVATRLLDALLADARAQGFTIVALCPYVAAQAMRHPEWDELFER